MDRDESEDLPQQLEMDTCGLRVKIIYYFFTSTYAPVATRRQGANGKARMAWRLGSAKGKERKGMERKGLGGTKGMMARKA